MATSSVCRTTIPLIQQAIDAAQPGDEIRIVGGGFEEAPIRLQEHYPIGRLEQRLHGHEPHVHHRERQRVEPRYAISRTNGDNAPWRGQWLAVLNGDATGLGG